VAFHLRDCWKGRDPSWDALDGEFDAGDMRHLDEFLRSELQSGRGFCPTDHRRIFQAFKVTSLDRLKVVILGQDPYPDCRAMGLAFSVPSQDDVARTPSLRNIYDAIEADIGAPIRSGDLTPWTEDGVLLLNTLLTVRRGEPDAHAGQGWEWFTDRVVEVVNEKHDPVIFLLWGEHARSKSPLVLTERHYVLHAAHPQARKNARLPLARARHFSLTNGLLKAQRRAPIRWMRA
jgi:uracil-DNA glycosylase